MLSDGVSDGGAMISLVFHYFLDATSVFLNVIYRIATLLLPQAIVAVSAPPLRLHLINKHRFHQL